MQVVGWNPTNLLQKNGAFRRHRRRGSLRFLGPEAPNAPSLSHFTSPPNVVRGERYMLEAKAFQVIDRMVPGLHFGAELQHYSG